MRSRVRITILAMACLICSSYFYWPNNSFQNVSFEQIAHTAGSKVGPTSSPHQKCHAYFDVLRDSSSSNPSKSRYLTNKQISNHIDHLRVFLKCQLDLQVNITQKYSTLGTELLPMFSEEVPAISNYDWSSFTRSKGYFWSRYLSEAKGRGIVISLGDHNTGYACRLIQVLHQIGNNLPIQFVHKGELSLGSIQRLKLAAESKQAVEFINVFPTLKSGYSSVFKGYNNKWFAVLFSTFEEIILMDADVVPFVKPETFFDFEGYVKTGAFFFRDRELSETLSQDQVDFFSKMIPKDDELFELSIDERKLDNNFFNFRSKHVMESGVVVLCRSSHISGILISLALQYWFRSGRVLYGDKDLYWLGQLISGNSDYHFNENAAAAVGVMDSNTTLCSTQIGHVSSDKKLLWTNGALSVCKKKTWFYDFFRYPHLRKLYNNSISSLRESYNSPVTIQSAIIPASLKSLNVKDSTVIKSNFAKDHGKGCGGKYYCASSDDGGEIISLSQEEQISCKKIISVWSGPLISDI